MNKGKSYKNSRSRKMKSRSAYADYEEEHRRRKNFKKRKRDIEEEYLEEDTEYYHYQKN